MSDSSDIQRYKDYSEMPVNDVVEIVGWDLKPIAWVGPMVCRVEGHA